ncbi:MAG: GNAT family N-acetyltransferase [Pleurocapsa minor HA4230-MV1]|jgi:GNAT superfamily N-acetyltransferase|nr:GNAT family N-acetyltransferase [Pleurocapsa minor HA4230-MV1]
MYTISSLNNQTAQRYECLTFPSYQKQLQKIGSTTIAIGASLMQQPIGLALAEIKSYPDGTSATVLSLFVKERYRNLGIGTALMIKLEAKLLVRGCNRVELIYMSGKATTTALEKLLTKLGWGEFKSRLLVCKSTTEKLAKAPWLRQRQLPSSYSIVPWVDLAPKYKQKIAQRQQQQEWYPESLNPFGEPDLLEPLNSLALLHHDEVVGWTINHRIEPDMIRYTSLFVRKDLQKIGRAIPMLTEAIRRQINSEIIHNICCVEAANAPMLQFVQRRLSPYLTSLTETKGTQKLLISQVSQLQQPCLIK